MKKIVEKAEKKKCPPLAPRPIPMEKWIWLGYPQHLCVADQCRFRMATIVGKYLISTVGDYHPTQRNGEPQPGMEAIGAGSDSFFETFVFRCNGLRQCGCCANTTDMGEVDGKRSATAVAARERHMEMCARYAKEK